MSRATPSVPGLAWAAVLTALAAAVAAASAPAQDDAAPRWPGFAPRAVVESFAADAGPGWRVRWDHGRGVPRLLLGGRRAVDPGRGTDADFERAARAVIDELAGALGTGSADLQLVEVRTLPLARIGSTDKVVVKLRQVVDGIATHQGTVHAIFSRTGELLALDNGALPHVRQTPLWPTVGLDAAMDAARAEFQARHGLPADSVALDDYVVFPAPVAAGRRAVAAAPAWLIEVAGPRGPARAGPPVRWMHAVAARGAPAVLDAWSLVHSADLAGTVSGWGQAGLLPDGADPAVQLPLEGARLVTAGQPDAISAPDGSFAFPGVASTQTVTATLDGPWATVLNDAGAEAVVSAAVSPGSPASLVFNAGLTEQQTAQVNAFRAIHDFRNWLRSVDPGESTFDFPVLAEVNVAATCNAVFQGDRVSFYLAGDGCVNSAYSTVVWHELGHWANQLYGSGNGFTGMGEGGADIWAMYVADDPLVGAGFKGPGTTIRDGTNTDPFCGDTNLNCYGESHANGRPLMGAVWKVRQRLKDDLGAAAGRAVADQLMLSWFQAFDDTEPISTIEDHWLILDDDNGDLDDGTPHFAQIDGGFRDNAWPGFDLPRVQIAHVPDDLVQHHGPVTIAADVVETLGTVAQADVMYSTDDGQSWTAAPMAFVGGDSWTGVIPGQLSPETVRYHLRVQATDGAVDTLPRGAPDDVFLYDVGVRTVHAAFDFEAAGDEGWTHQQILTQDDWMRGAPGGKSVDPAGAHSGSKVWGNDLGPEGYNGAYQPDVHNALRSPALDLSSATSTRLRYRRWLTVERGEFDTAEVLVDGVPVWSNPFDADVMDRIWTLQDHDVSALADGDPSVQVSFELRSDGGLELGGWNVDDVEVVSLAPVTDSAFLPYGVGTPGFGGMVPTLAGTGFAVPGGPVTISVGDARPGAFGVLFIGNDQVAVPGLGGTFLVTPILTFIVVPTDGSGQLELAASLPNKDGLTGLQVTLQFWLVDPDGLAGYAGTNGLLFVIGPG